MTLSNAQYDAIQREYQARQLKNRRILENRREEIYEKIPAYRKLTAGISTLSVTYGRKLLEEAGDGEEEASRTKALEEEYHEKLVSLSREKQRLLTEAGYAADYLEPLYDCPDCRDTGFQNGERCHCFKQRISDFLYEQSNLSGLLSNENFSTLSYDYYEGNDLVLFKKAVELSFTFIRNFDTEYRNLLFYGEVGTGKSFLSNCIACELLKQGKSVIYFSASGLFNLLSRYSFSSNTAEKEKLYHTYEDLYGCDLVIIDDLGTEMSNTFTNSQFFTFLNERELRKRPVLISTNLGLEELKSRYSERIFSRLTGNFTFRKLSGPDIRTCQKI